jgi:hypothetical protein
LPGLFQQFHALRGRKVRSFAAYLFCPGHAIAGRHSQRKNKCARTDAQAQFSHIVPSRFPSN